MANKPVFILDSFAILAYLQGETGMDRIKGELENAKAGHSQIYMCVINLGEVLYIIERERGLAKAHEVLAVIQQMPVNVLSVDHQIVFDAAHIKANHALSYADAFAVVCAQRFEGTILTGDKEFETVAPFVKVEWLK